MTFLFFYLFILNRTQKDQISIKLTNMSHPKFSIFHAVKTLLTLQHILILKINYCNGQKNDIIL